MKWRRFGLLLLLPLLASCAHDSPAASQRTAATRPAEIRRGMLFTGDRTQRQREYFQQLLARIEPTGHGDIHRLAVYLDFFKREFIRDRRLFAFQASAHPDRDGRIHLQGFVEFQEQHEALKSLLTHLGFAIARDDIEVLPSKDLGARCYAVVTAGHAFLYDRPGTGRRETLDECQRGDRIFLLKAAGMDFLCHGADGYVGYIRSSAIERMDAESLAHVAPEPDEHADQSARAIATARRFLGTKYVWGGTTTAGIDCSGLVRRAYGAIGVALPRDADQQALVGKLVALRWFRQGLRAGDTLYFLSRRGTIHHTALYIGNEQFIEATEPVAKISSFDPASPLYSKKRDLEFCFARRILTSADRAPAAGPSTRQAVMVPRPPIVSRQEWGSTPQPIPESARQTPTLITLHHGGVIWKPGTDPVKFVRSVQTYGQKEKGWPDLPYHFMIAPDGRIFEGRPLEFAPQSNTKYPLKGHIGIELMGNFEVQRPSLAQLRSAAALTAWLCESRHIDPSQIAGHKDRAPGQTVCPGKDFYRYLADGQFIGWVRQILAGQTPAIEPGPPLPGGPTAVIDAPTTPLHSP